MVDQGAKKIYWSRRGTFSPSDICSAWPRDGDKQLRREQAKSAPRRKSVEQCWRRSAPDDSPWCVAADGRELRRIGIMIIKLLTAITTAETGLSKSLLRASDRAIIGASSSAAIFSVPLMIASPHTLKCVSVSPSKIHGNFALFQRYRQSGEDENRHHRGEAASQERRCTRFPQKALENSTNLSTKDCICGVILFQT